MSVTRILVGEIGRPHGVRGLVKLKSFTADPAAIADYGPLTDAEGTRVFRLVLKAEGLAQLEGITDRDAAALLTGTQLYVDRAALPPVEDEDEFYLADLIGLAAVTEAGEELGRIRALGDYGAGPYLEVVDATGQETLLPFTKAVVPLVDVRAGRVVVVPPGTLDAREEAGNGDDAAGQGDTGEAA